MPRGFEVFQKRLSGMKRKVAKVKCTDDVRSLREPNKYVALKSRHAALLLLGEFREVVRSAVGDRLWVDIEADCPLCSVEFYPFTAQCKSSAEVFPHDGGFLLVEVSIYEPHKAGILTRGLNGLSVCCVFIKGGRCRVFHTALCTNIVRFEFDVVARSSIEYRTPVISNQLGRKFLMPRRLHLVGVRKPCLRS